MPKPIIFLAFANDRVDYSRYLRNLPIEQRQIREALESAQAAGLCEIVERNNASLTDILDTFQKYQDRIAIFHYGGHADGYQLLLETPTGEHSVAHGGGLVSFFARQKGLKLIFLNGCSTQQQSLELIQNGIPAVIGTSNSINDEVATSLSVRFYRGLAKGLSLERTWNEALDAAKMEKGNDLKAFYRSKKELEVDAFPWNFHIREGSEIVKQWNLPDEVQNPLFGLPELPQKFNLPVRPFRFLERYKPQDAELFYGRSAYIRELYNRCTDHNSAPLILFNGQSGSGKSSLLDAGLLPRLEQVCKVVYLRRDAGLGLWGTFKTVFKVEESANSVHNQSIEKEIAFLENAIQHTSLDSHIHLRQAIEQLRQKQKASIKALWQAAEKDKPLIIILDQAEECFTRPNRNLVNELEHFLLEVKDIFENPQDKPQGKLILSYRKEYSSEMEEAIKNLEIPREKIFLQHLDREGIIEIVLSLTKTERLQRRYNLSIEPELPMIIADDLLEDKESSIAPILQILLTKLWNLAEKDESFAFTVANYQRLRKEGILLDDFFDQQVGKLREKYQELEETGLVLDILHFHTTNLGTAETHSLDEMRNRYGENAERLDQISNLLNEFKHLYLLMDAGTSRTGLAHDTLAPLVKQRFKNSDKMGQRASLILENKVRNYEIDVDSLLDKEDLTVVEQGTAGMRLWTAKEAELIRKSQAKRARERQKNKLIRIASVFALAIILGTAVFAFFEREKAEKQAVIATESLQKVQIKEIQERVQRTNALLAANENAVPIITEIKMMIKDLPAKDSLEKVLGQEINKKLVKMPQNKQDSLKKVFLGLEILDKP